MRSVPLFRVGIGYDVHPLKGGRKLILGGVHIPFPKGLVGHSDADVLSHAIGEALLGAAGLGDLGAHFPDSDPRWEDTSSLILLRNIRILLRQAKWAPAQIDSTLVLQKPRIASFVPNMRANVAEALNLPVLQVNVKAKSPEGIGAVGAGRGVSAYAVAMVIPAVRKSKRS